ncbi:heavy metal-responsive transcriptional regulator [Egibacter rhizosphaerae]|uniref:Heavy metal-responsive transcriptional regulator n=1 Tax=Egibacter rhizosphaerae TaxID=1670831 RepID=A0A411YC93_9ACTN|nr:heavy metal-responsive transcriptional regulator [Egibacter rhizosphaerae]QBI18795.1 heavy metal-responsive transcriptional regulator [Egibacter rhizosphaerae]
MLIGELAAATGTSAKTLRFYEAEGLLAEPDRTPAGYRDYPDAAIGRVGFIRQAQAAGLTLAQITQVLAVRDGGHPPCAHVADLVEHRLGEVTRRLDELERTRAELLALRQRLAALDPIDCHDDTICAAVPMTSSSRPH